jgi:RNA polymerase sigma factor (sigma-70 family)
MFLAIDEMRKDGLLRRADAPTLKLEPNSPEGELELPDPGSDRESQRLEAREFCGRLLQRLSEPERSLLEMIYSDKLAYKEIASIFQISESAVCLRHKAVLAKLRRQATVRRAA